MSYESRLADLEARVKALEHRLLTQQEPVNNPSRPTKAEVRIHFEGCGRSDPEAKWEIFYDKYDSQDWIAGNGVKITNWRSKASEWMRLNPKPESPPVQAVSVVSEYVPKRNATLDYLKAQTEVEGVPMPDEIRCKLAALGIGTRRTMRVNSDRLAPIGELIDER